MIQTDSLLVTLGTTTTELTSVTDCTVNLDEGASPYATATLTVAMPSLAVLAQLDPTARPYLRIRADRRSLGSSSSFDPLDIRLRVVDRVIDVRGGTVALGLANDETFLDYAPAADIDLSSFYYSLRQITLKVLQTATADPAVAVFIAKDFTFRPASTVRNIMPEGGFEQAVLRWRPVNSRLDISPSYPRQGANTLRIQPINSSFDSFAELDPGFTPGKTYRVSGYRTTDVSGGVSSDGRPFNIVIVANMNGYAEVIALGVSGSTASERVVEFTMPPNVTASSVRLYNGANNTSTGAVYWDAVSIYEAPFRDQFGTLEYFDGDTLDTDEYVYTWDGARGQSTSTRRPRVTRNQGALIWRAGQTARDFLNPMLQSQGLRLFHQPESGSSWTIADSAFKVQLPTRLDYRDDIYQVVESNGFDSTHPDGSPLWADAVAITYKWTDDEGNDREASDVDAPAGYRKLYQLTLDDTPYPGPGQARYLRSRFAMRARQMTVTSRIKYDTKPSKELTIVTEHAGLVTGTVDSVTFDHVAAEMTVVGKNLVSTPATAWNQLGWGTRWSDSPVGASWASETA